MSDDWSSLSAHEELEQKIDRAYEKDVLLMLWIRNIEYHTVLLAT